MPVCVCSVCRRLDCAMLYLQDLPMGSNCDLKVFLAGQGSLKNKLAGFAVCYLSVVQSIFPSLSKLLL